MQPELNVDPSIYAKPFPKFGRPKVIGYIGLDNLKFAREVTDKKVNFNLNLHINEAKHKPDDLDVKLYELLNFLIEHESRLQYPLENKLNSAKFYCYRGLLTCVACTPYEIRDAWKIVAILYKGNIYLCARDTEEKTIRKRNLSEKDKRFTSWGYKFEQFMLSDRPDVEPNPHQAVDETEEFSLVFTTNINKHQIVYGAEMDGIRCDKCAVHAIPDNAHPDDIVKYLADKEFVEMKTNRHIENAKQDRNFRRFKVKKWWCQSFLVGINSILCGFRNDDGIVEELKVFNVRDLPKMSKHIWDPNVCFNFLDTFLTFVKQCLSREITFKHSQKALGNLQSLPLITLLFEWRPGTSIQVAPGYSHDDDPILSKWFMENFGKSCGNI